jgi:Domain of unknown function (DUF4440)/NIPSNAP
MDLRTYALVSGGRGDFDRILREEALPMLLRAGIRVVGYGPSLADDDQYFLARAFASQAEREEQLTAFYGSDEWRQNYEDAVARLIASYHKVVIPLATRVADALDVDAPQAEMAAVAELHRLNDEYLRALVESDAAWFAANASDDSTYTLADGRYVDKTCLLAVTGRGPAVTDLSSDEVDVCPLGDVALVCGAAHWLRADTRESTRYTTVWRLGEGRWQAVSAQFTPVAE